MSITKLLASAAFLTAVGFAVPASASVVTGSWDQQTAASPAKQQLLARNGADDGAAHQNDTRRSGEGAGHARNGSDDGAGHDANDDHGRGRGQDDGAGHAALQSDQPIILAKDGGRSGSGSSSSSSSNSGHESGNHGADNDDGPNHEVNEHNGVDNDDGPNHM